MITCYCCGDHCTLSNDITLIIKRCYYVFNVKPYIGAGRFGINMFLKISFLYLGVIPLHRLHHLVEINLVLTSHLATME